MRRRPGTRGVEWVKEREREGCDVCAPHCRLGDAHVPFEGHFWGLALWYGDDVPREVSLGAKPPSDRREL